MRAVLFVALPFLVLALNSCERVANLLPKNKEAHAAPGGPMPVQVAKPIAGSFQASETFTGRLEAVQSVDIRSQVSGYLASINFRAGVEVKAGDVLFQIDPRPYEAALNQANASVASANAALESARREADRAEQLLSSNAIAQQESDQRQTELLAAQAQVQNAEATLATARLNLEFTTIKAPVDGRISREQLTVGNLVQAGSAAPPLALLTSTDTVYVTFDVPESVVLKHPEILSDSDAKPVARVEFDSAPGRVFPAQLDYVANEVDRSTGTLSVRGVIQDAQGLVPGMFCRVALDRGEPEPVQLVAEQAILADQGQSLVWVADANNQVAFRPVIKGEVIDGYRAITQGLGPDDRVIVAGVMLLRPGMPVVAHEVPMPKLLGEAAPVAAAPEAGGQAEPKSSTAAEPAANQATGAQPNAGSPPPAAAPADAAAPVAGSQPVQPDSNQAPPAPSGEAAAAP